MMVNPKTIRTLLFIGLFGCSSHPLLENFRRADRDQRDSFLQYYPALTHNQRREILEDPTLFDDLLKEWEIPKVKTPSRNGRILFGLIIEPKIEEPITQGTEIQLSAFALYEDGRKVPVTEDIKWKAYPQLAEIQGSTLHFECATSDITVTANFLEEIEASVTYKVRKQISTFEVKKIDSYSSSQQYEFAKLKLIAKCADGTEEDVSCQAEWTSPSQTGTFSGCGYYSPGQKDFVAGKAQIKVQYNKSNIYYNIPLSSFLQ